MEQKKLGFGMMRLPLLDQNDPKSLDIEQIQQMVDEYMARGFNYFDTAWMYHSGESECLIKKCLLDKYPRDSYTVTAKASSPTWNTTFVLPPTEMFPSRTTMSR